MIYLNEVEEGGETDFSQINTTFSPKKRMAIGWKNSDGTGSENPASIHAGMPVVKGRKMIITKWYREREWNINEDYRLKDEYHANQSKEMINTTEKTYKTNNDLPRLSPLGFKVVKVPTNSWRLIQEAYKLLQNVKNFIQNYTMHIMKLLEKWQQAFGCKMLLILYLLKGKQLLG
jgi:hypothetical protein